LLVVLSAKGKSICSNKQGIRQIVSNDSARLKRDLPEPVTNFSDRQIALKECNGAKKDRSMDW
jgi:hypothetical protein